MREARRLWRIVAFCAALVSGLLFHPAPVRGQGNLQLGPFRILTSVDLSGEYNDNILLAPRNEQSDFIWTLAPGISIELPGRRSAFRLGYRAGIVRYTDHEDLDTVEHTVQADARFNFPGRLSLTLTDEFKRTQAFAGFPVPEQTTRVERNENNLHLAAEYGVRDRIALGFDYNFLWVDYDAGPEFDELDRQDHLFGVTLYYRILPKTSVLGEYDYQIIRYDIDRVARDRDSAAHMFKVGLKGDLTAKTTAIVKVGYEVKDYDNPARQDFDGLIVEGEVIWKYREPSQLRIYGGRANIESTFQSNNFLVATYGGAELRHYITPTLIAKVRGLAGINEYPAATAVETETKERFDYFYEFAAGIRYQIRRWLSVDLDYQFLVRDSNFGDFDYTNNRVVATVRVTY